MGIYVNNRLVYVERGAKLNTQLAMGGGSQKTVVVEWDNCGGASTTRVNVTIGVTTSPICRSPTGGTSGVSCLWSTQFALLARELTGR